MSILNYFQKSGTTKHQRQNVVLPSAEAIGASYVEYINISEAVNQSVGRSGRTTYKEEEKIRITKYANLQTTTNALKHFKKEFPNLSEPSVHRWLSTYRKHLKAKVNSGKIVISQRRGRPLSLPEELDSKLRKFLLNIWKAGGCINRQVISGVLIGLIKSDYDKYGRMTRMNLSRRMVPASHPIITKSIWEEVRLKFLHDIVDICIEHQIPDERIINIDQTPREHVATGMVTMAEKGSRHMSRKGADDKRQITATLSETLSGQILSFQLI